MNPRVLLAAFVVPLALIIAAVPQNTTTPYKLTAPELLERAVSGEQFIHPDQVADMLINKDPQLQLIDVRTPDEFDKFSLPGAVNIPLTSLLSPEFRDIIDQDIKMNVFFSNGSIHANEAWMITRQLGFKNNFVLQGGLNYWAETIMNPVKPASTSPDEEIAKYNFRLGASKALGGELEVNAPGSVVSTEKPVIIKKPAKKKIQGGC